MALIVAHLTKLALDGKATPPSARKPGAKGAGVTPEVRAKASTRWDTNKNGDGKLPHEEFVGRSVK